MRSPWDCSPPGSLADRPRTDGEWRTRVARDLCCFAPTPSALRRQAPELHFLTLCDPPVSMGDDEAAQSHAVEALLRLEPSLDAPIASYLAGAPVKLRSMFVASA